jgi:hypothetical protein
MWLRVGAVHLGTTAATVALAKRTWTLLAVTGAAIESKIAF